MLDPLSALSLAGNLIQFVDFGRKVISGGTQLYRSAEGVLPWVAELEYTTDNFARLSSSLSIVPNNPVGHTSPEEESLKQLARRCKSQADELLKVLEKLRVDTAGKKGAQGKLKSLHHALKTVWKEKEIKEYSRRLSESRSQLLVSMIALLGNRQSSVVSTLNTISVAHKQHEIHSNDSIDLLRTEIVNDLKILKSAIRTNSDLKGVGTRLDRLAEVSEKMQKEVDVLSSLQFSVMRNRYSSIPEAHFQTFQWIFSDVRDDRKPQVYFQDWLRSQDRIFWTSGKAGSGKSTLMKFLSNHPLTDEILKEWAGGKPLVKASFYFWNPGSEMQKSQEGLFQSLLYGILRRLPELIPTVCENRWQDPMGGSEQWTRAELLKTFSTLQSQALGAVRFCFFIDGLDEYAGDHFEILEVMRKIASTPGIKLCLSSRPWNVFNKALGSDPTRMLMLHELTQNDIRLYVKNIFEEDSQIAEKVEEDGEFQTFTQEIVQRAEGVFLWVFLVVRSLLRGAHEGDEIRDFQRRLREVPTDLERYFKQMLDSVEKVYHAEAARIYLICLGAPGPPSVMTISYFNRLETGFDNSFPAKLNSEVARGICKTAQTRINARCRDLLEFRSAGNNGPSSQSGLGPLAEVMAYPKVEFLHRTVRDFLETPDMQELLVCRASLAFEVDKFLANAYLTQIICLGRHTGAVVFESLVDDCIFHAHRLEAAHRHDAASILDSLDSAISTNAMDKVLNRPASSLMGNSILEFAVQRQLPRYVEAKLSGFDSKLLPSRLSSLLELSLTRPSPSKYSWDLDIDILQSLLGAGADPNWTFGPGADSHSAWCGYLLWLSSLLEAWQEAQYHAQYQQNLLAVQVLIRNGAFVPGGQIPNGAKHYNRPSSTHPKTAALSSVSVEKVLKKAFKTEDSRRLLELMRQHSNNSHSISKATPVTPEVGQSAVSNRESASPSKAAARYMPWNWFSSG